MRLPIEIINLIMEYTHFGKFLVYHKKRKCFVFRFDESHVNFTHINRLFQSVCFLRCINIPEHIQTHILYKNTEDTEYTILVIDEIQKKIHIHNYYSSVYSKNNSFLILL